MSDLYNRCDSIYLELEAWLHEQGRPVYDLVDGVSQMNDPEWQRRVVEAREYGMEAALSAWRTAPHFKQQIINDQLITKRV